MRKLLVGSAVALIIIIAALAGMWMEFSSLQACKPSIQDPESLVGYWCLPTTLKITPSFWPGGTMQPGKRGRPQETSDKRVI